MLRWNWRTHNWSVLCAGTLLATTGCCSISVGPKVCNTPACDSGLSADSPVSCQSDGAATPSWQSSAPDVRMQPLPPEAVPSPEPWRGGHTPPSPDMTRDEPAVTPAPIPPVKDDLPSLPGVGAKSKVKPEEDTTAPKKLLDQAKDWLPTWPKPKPMPESSSTTQYRSSQKAAGQLDRPSFAAMLRRSDVRARLESSFDSKEVSSTGAQVVEGQVAKSTDRSPEEAALRERTGESSTEFVQRVAADSRENGLGDIGLAESEILTTEPSVPVSTTKAATSGKMSASTAEAEALVIPEPVDLPVALRTNPLMPSETGQTSVGESAIQLGDIEFIDDEVPQQPLAQHQAGEKVPVAGPAEIAPLPKLPVLPALELPSPAAVPGTLKLSAEQTPAALPRVLPMTAGSARPLPAIMPAQVLPGGEPRFAPWPPLPVHIQPTVAQ